MNESSSLRARADRGELDPAEFDHERHVELAFRYLEELELSAAVARMEAAIRRVAEAAGAPEKYHATITWAYCVIIAERMQASPNPGWSAFKAANPDLFDHGLGLLLRYYSRERLFSDTARRQFVIPAPG